MKNAPSGKQIDKAADDLLPEYDFDYSQAKPNRFAASCSQGGRMVVLEPDVAQVFATAESVNSVLRALISTMPPVASR